MTPMATVRNTSSTVTPTSTEDAARPVVTQNVFTIILEHSETVDNMSQQVRDIVNALPAVSKCGILLPSFPERNIVLNDGSGDFGKVLR